MSPFLQTYLTPNATAVKFAIKTTLAMMLALYIALLFDLERPYWALISAAFLQIRPMSGMVVEKRHLPACRHFYWCCSGHCNHGILRSSPHTRTYHVD